MQAIADWLEKLGMSEYAQRFAENRSREGSRTSNRRRSECARDHNAARWSVVREVSQQRAGTGIDHAEPLSRNSSAAIARFRLTLVVMVIRAQSPNGKR